MPAALAARSVADLVVILEVSQEAVAGQAAGGTSMPAPSKLRVTSVVDEHLTQRLCDVGDRPKVPVVAVALAGENRVQGVMEVVVPLGIEAVATELARSHDTGIV